MTILLLSLMLIFVLALCWGLGNIIYTTIHWKNYSKEERMRKHWGWRG